MDEFGGYDESFRISQDYDLWVRLTARRKSANLPLRLVCYRNLDTALSKVGRTTAFDEARRISERAEVHSFGRELSSEERRLVASFREGLDPADRRAFWDVYDSLIPPLKSPDRSRLIAAHHLKIAGACGAGAKCLEVLAAFRQDPAFVSRWLIERLQG